MTARKLDKISIEKIYENHLVFDFPKDEVKPLATIINGFDKGVYNAYGLYDGNQLLAYAFFIIDKKCRLLDYFAVVRGKRGGGIGSHFLNMLKAELKPVCELVIIESENPDTAQNESQKITRLRRIDFYLKNGLIDTKSRAKVFGVEYKILSLPLSHTAKFTPQIYLSIYKNLLTKELFEENIKVER